MMLSFKKFHSFLIKYICEKFQFPSLVLCKDPLFSVLKGNKNSKSVLLEFDNCYPGMVGEGMRKLHAPCQAFNEYIKFRPKER